MPPQPQPQAGPPTAQQPHPGEFARVFMIIMLLIFVYNSPNQDVPPGFAGSPHDYAAERIARTRRSLDVLNATDWGGFAPSPLTNETQPARFLNLTGFGEEDGYAWDRLGAFRERSKMFSDHAKGKGRIGKDLSALEGEIYDNVTGVVHGRWVRHTADLPSSSETHRRFNLTAIAPGIDWGFQDEEFWGRNVTGMEGKMTLRVDETDVEEVDTTGVEAVVTDTEAWAGGVVRTVEARLTIQDESSSGDGYEMKIHGVHWPKQGVLLMTTTSDKFAGIFGLPHLTTHKDYFDTSQKILNRTLEKRVERMEKSVWIDPSNPWSSSPEAQGDAVMPAPHCEYVVYVQIQPIDPRLSLTLEAGNEFIDYAAGTAASLVSDIEKELRFPNGAPLPNTPRLRMSTVVFSPDCGFMLESKGQPDFASEDAKHLTGLKHEVWIHNIHNLLLALAAINFGQLLLLKIQSKEASTPSTVGRVSLHTIGMMLMVDAMLALSFSLMSASAPEIFPSALLASFTAAMSAIFGVKFVFVIYNTQEPERRAALAAEVAAAEANRPPPTTVAVPVLTAARADVVSSSPQAPPTSTPPPDPPIIIPSDQDIDAEIAENVAAASSVPTPATALLPTTNPARPAQTRQRLVSNFGAVYIKFVLILALILFVSITSFSWPPVLRTAYIHLLSMTYLSFWVPQIRRNVIRNCRKALLWKYIIGQSILRLLPFAYFYLTKDNFLFSETDWIAFTVYAGWVWIQIWVLVGQEILGPRWGLLNGWTEEGWDYHPVLKEDNMESGSLPVGLVRNPGSPTLERGQNPEESRRRSKEGGLRSVDCVICKEVLEVHVIGEGGDVGGAANGVSGMLARRLYMVTPCRHIFHSRCLEDWMRFRLQCPICRETLPPL